MLVNKHGIPGIGVTGKPGKKGKTGNSFYMGPIDQFFEFIGENNLTDSSIDYDDIDYNITYAEDEERLSHIYNEGDIVGVYGYESDVRIEEVRWDGSSYSYKVYLAGEEEWLYGDDIAYDVETYNSSAAYNPRPSLTNSIEKKKKEYPKTYEECCKILDFCGEYFFTTYEDGIHFPGEDNNIYKILKSTSILTKLLICRDAYWKIAGEEMELGKSWKPDYNDFNKTLSMYCLCGKFGLSVINPLQFVFPSKEMRDEFAENFKKDIDSCNNFC